MEIVKRDEHGTLITAYRLTWHVLGCDEGVRCHLARLERGDNLGLAACHAPWRALVYSFLAYTEAHTAPDVPLKKQAHEEDAITSWLAAGNSVRYPALNLAT